MIVHFCPDCGSYSLGPVIVCDECHAALPEDSWTEVTHDELHQLEYVEELDAPPGLPSWEYDVVKLKSDAEAGGTVYTSALLRRMGEKGWELVSVVPLGDRDGPRYAVFKRSWNGDAYG